MPEVVQSLYHYANHEDVPCRFALRIFRDPYRPVVVLITDQEQEVWPGSWCRQDPREDCMRAVYQDVVQEPELDPDCLVWIETDRGGRLERVDYGRSMRRWRLSSAAVLYLIGESWSSPRQG
jgi:hypothetical protein